MNTQTLSQNGLWSKLVLTLKMIKVQHSIFALPFALVSTLVASKGRPEPLTLIMIILAMITARNAAMSFNRYADADIDKTNPRTAKRELPTGLLSKNFTLVFCIVNALLFIGISSFFNKLTLILSPFALAIILGYSLSKRFTSYTQIFLGLALGISPLAAWIAIQGQLTLFPCLLGTAVFCWVAGFDIIYATLDIQSDQKNHVRNIVNRLGLREALRLSKFLHFMAILLFFGAGYVQDFGLLYNLGVTLVAGMLFYEQMLVKPHDLSKVNMAFFAINGYVALLYLVFTGLDIYI